MVKDILNIQEKEAAIVISLSRDLIQDSLTDIGTFVIHVGRNERIFFKA